jgi:DNA processing protein
MVHSRRGAIRSIQRGEPGYPERLESMAGPPARLWVQGEWPLTQRPVVALVGARAASVAAMSRTADLAAELSQRGALVISGGALGIDAAAHLGVVRAGRPTLAVVAPGLDDPYPARNARIFDDIVHLGGALLSSIPPGTPVQKWHFPARNHVIAALADATVVTECGAISGSTITARAARALGRVVGATPGSTGTDALVAAGAAVVESADDVFAALAGSARRPQTAGPDPDSPAARVLDALDRHEALGVDAIARRTGLPTRQCASALSELELSGLAVAIPGARFLKSAVATLPVAAAKSPLERN